MSVWKLGGIFFGVIAIVGVVFWVMGLFGEAGSVSQKEFGPKAALDKYQWFVDQAAAVKKMDADISLFEQKVKGVEKQYESYGKDKSKWRPDISMQYNQAMETARTDLMAIVSQRNNLVKEFNAASGKFNWQPFNTRQDLPSQLLKEYSVSE